LSKHILAVLRILLSEAPPGPSPPRPSRREGEKKEKEAQPEHGKKRD